MDILRDLNNWRAIRQQQAVNAAGTTEGMQYLAEATRYGVIYEQIVALQEQLAEVEASNKAVESALEGVDYRGSYADGVLYLKQQLADRMSPGMALALKATIRDLSDQLAAALAACEVKQAALQEIIDLMSESYGLTGFHLNGDVAPWSELEEGGRFERLTSLNNAVTIQPDASALKAHDEALIEKCAVVCEEYQGSAETCAAAIRKLKSVSVCCTLTDCSL